MDADLERSALEAVQRGDRGAFPDFVKRHDRWVRGVIYGVLGDSDRVDDVAQQVWSSVWERLGELRDADRWRSWLYRMAHNAAIDAGRDQTRRRKKKLKLLQEPPGPLVAPAPTGAMVDDERHRAVWEAIGSLPAHYREPFVLRHLEGWSYQQIGDLMDMPVDTVETRLVRARRMLRERLAGKV